MIWSRHDRADADAITYTSTDRVGVNLGELLANEELLAMVNVVPADIHVIDLEASDGGVALRFMGPGVAIEIALPIPAIRFISLIDGAITHATRG